MSTRKDMVIKQGYIVTGVVSSVVVKKIVEYKIVICFRREIKSDILCIIIQSIAT